MPRTTPDKNSNYPLDEHSPAEQLDAVLLCLVSKDPAFKTAQEIALQLSEEQHIVATQDDVKEVLNKLIKDGFAQVVAVNPTHSSSGNSAFLAIKQTPCYFATFEGRVLIDYENGYEGRQGAKFANEIRIQKLEDEQRNIQRKTFWLALFAGVIGVLVFIVSLIQLLLYWKEQYPKFPLL